MAFALNMFRLRGATWASVGKNKAFIAMQVEIQELKRNNLTRMPAATNPLRENLYAWKKLSLKDGKNTKKVSGKLYHWCEGHSMWTIYSPSQCKLRKEESDKILNTKSRKEQLVLARAYQAILEDEDGANALVFSDDDSNDDHGSE
jgi:hypothetical protein